MPPLTREDLALSLLSPETEKLIASENPYYQAQSIPQVVLRGTTRAIGEDPTRYSTSDIIKTQALGGLLSALLGRAGQGYQETLTDRYLQAVTDARRGVQPTVPLPPNLRTSAKRTGQLFGAASAIQDLAEAREMQMAGERAFETARQGKLGELAAWEEPNQEVRTGPVTLSARDLLNPAKIESRRLEREKRLDYFKVQDELEKQFEEKPAVKDMRQVERYSWIIDKALKDPVSVSDQELTRYSILLIEPGMAVREGEQAAMANSPSIPARWKGSLRKALFGEAELTEDVREGIKRLAIRAYDGHKMQYDRIYADYVEKAKRRGIDPTEIPMLKPAQSKSEIFQLPKETTNTREMSTEELLSRYNRLKGNNG